MKICRLQDTSFSHDDVLALIKESFQQWQEKGLGSILLQFTTSEFAEKTADAIVLVAFDDTSNALYGTTTFTLAKDKKGERYAYNKYSAVKKNTKQSGVGSQLLEYGKQVAREEGCSYILSNTSVLADWSVKWHKKNGFKTVGLYSTVTSDYYSYLFRYQLKSPSIWNNSLFTGLVYCWSCLKTRAMKRRDGGLTWFGNSVSKVLKFLRLA